MSTVASSMSETVASLVESARRDKAEAHINFAADGSVIVEWETDLICVRAEVTERGQTITLTAKAAE